MASSPSNRQMMTQKSTCLTGLPNEMLIRILDQLHVTDIFRVVMLNRHFHCLLFDYWFDRQYIWYLRGLLRKERRTRRARRARIQAKRTGQTLDTSKKIPEFRSKICWSLFRYAHRADSPSIMDYITARMKEIDFNQPLLPRAETSQTMGNGYVQFAFFEDAPRVVAWFQESGVEKVNGLRTPLPFPLLPSFCLTLSTGHADDQEELDSLLRMACLYMLPRTIESMLKLGANPNAYNDDGLNALHCLVLWNEVPYKTLYERGVGRGLKRRSWDPNVWLEDAIPALVAHGVEIDSTTRCPSTCSKPSECSHRRETAFHIASRNERICTILDLKINGADPCVPDRFGRTAMYGAVEHKQNHWPIIALICNDKNPIAYLPTRSTALHIACRFGHFSIVRELLVCETPPNVVDSQGLTPLHEALQNVELERKDIMSTLLYLRKYQADPDPRTTAAITIRELVESHPLKAVRGMFGLRRRERAGPAGSSEAGEPSPGYETVLEWKADLAPEVRQYTDTEDLRKSSKLIPILDIKVDKTKTRKSEV